MWTAVVFMEGVCRIRYGYYRWDTKAMLITVAMLVVLMQVLQAIGNLFSKKIDHRRV